MLKQISRHKFLYIVNYSYIFNKINLKKSITKVHLELSCEIIHVHGYIINLGHVKICTNSEENLNVHRHH